MTESKTTIIWYHGTTSNKATRIFSQGFKNAQIHFATSPEVADYFAWEMGTRVAIDKIPNLTRIEIVIPATCLETITDYASIVAIGNAEDRPVDIGDGMEIILSPKGVMKLNELIKSGKVTLSRRIIFHPKKGI